MLATDFSFITENLRILNYCLLKVLAMLGKLQNIKFTFHKNKQYHEKDREIVNISCFNE